MNVQISAVFATTFLLGVVHVSCTSADNCTYMDCIFHNIERKNGIENDFINLNIDQIPDNALAQCTFLKSRAERCEPQITGCPGILTQPYNIRFYDFVYVRYITKLGIHICDQLATYVRLKECIPGEFQIALQQCVQDGVYDDKCIRSAWNDHGQCTVDVYNIFNNLYKNWLRQDPYNERTVNTSSDNCTYMDCIFHNIKRKSGIEDDFINLNIDQIPNNARGQCKFLKSRAQRCDPQITGCPDTLTQPYNNRFYDAVYVRYITKLGIHICDQSATYVRLKECIPGELQTALQQCVHDGVYDDKCIQSAWNDHGQCTVNVYNIFNNLYQNWLRQDPYNARTVNTSLYQCTYIDCMYKNNERKGSVEDDIVNLNISIMPDLFTEEGHCKFMHDRAANCSSRLTGCPEVLTQPYSNRFYDPVYMTYLATVRYHICLVISEYLDLYNCIPGELQTALVRCIYNGVYDDNCYGDAWFRHGTCINGEYTIFNNLYTIFIKRNPYNIRANKPLIDD